MSEDFWKRINELSHGHSLRKIALDSIVPYPTLSKAKLRGNIPGHEILSKLAAYFGVSTDYLLTGQDLSKDRAPVSYIPKIPMLDRVQAGGCTGINDHSYPGVADEYIETDLPGARLFGLRIRGDSMHPKFEEGMTVIINPDLVPQPGDYVVAKIDEENEATFKQLKRVGTVYFLHPINPAYDDIPVSKKVRILGKMVRIQMDY